MYLKKELLEPSWLNELSAEFDKPYFSRLNEFLSDDSIPHLHYPPLEFVFHAFWQTPFHRVKVVILGQDPYINPGQAHGLSFSVPGGIPLPPSLKNIFKELHSDLGISFPRTGNLSNWAGEGVLLLNAVLTVRAGESGSHAEKGWEKFTDAAIHALSKHRQHLVFMLWGNYAKNKVNLIDPAKHLVLTAGHPSPLSVRFFSGCRHFSQANIWLEKNGIDPVNWQL
jgi:uracil-DNA glycosylase